MNSARHKLHILNLSFNFSFLLKFTFKFFFGEIFFDFFDSVDFLNIMQAEELHS